MWRRGGGGNDAPADPPALLFGSTDPAASRSGLDYADGTQDVDDLTDQTHTVRVTRTVTNTVTGEVREITTDEVVTLGAPDANGRVQDFTITLDGETLAFVDREFVRADGARIQGQERSGAVNLPATDFVSAFRVTDNGLIFGLNGDEITNAFSVTGFETDPNVIAMNTGAVTYTGGVDGLNDNNGGGFFDGTFILNASFADSTVDGAFALTSFDTAFGEGSVDLDLAPTSITGNGFAGDLTVGDCSFDACTSASEIGGVFYGPNAEEVGGIMSVDITVTDGGVSDQVNGTGAFAGAANP